MNAFTIIGDLKHWLGYRHGCETGDSPYYKGDRIYILAYFLYLGGLMVVDWSGFMTRYNIETPIFLSYIVVVGCIVMPYLVFYWKKLNPNVKPPYLVRCLSAYMNRLEDQHSIWFDVLYVLKLLLYFVTILWMICILLLILAAIAWTIVLILLSN